MSVGFRIRLTEAQVSALEVYCADPIHSESEAELIRNGLRRNTVYRGGQLTLPLESLTNVRRYWCEISNTLSDSVDPAERRASWSFTALMNKLGHYQTA